MAGGQDTPRLDPAGRAAALDALSRDEVQVLVVGGGVVGAGIALDAVTRGLSTGLLEARDFASGTSDGPCRICSREPTVPTSTRAPRGRSGWCDSLPQW